MFSLHLTKKIENYFSRDDEELAICKEIKESVLQCIKNISEKYLNNPDFNIKRIRVIIHTTSDMPPSVYYQYSNVNKAFSIILHKNPVLNDIEQKFLKSVKYSISEFTNNDSLLELYGSVMSSSIEVVL